MNQRPSQGRPSSSLHFAMGEVSGKLDQLMVAILPRLEALERADQHLETRIGSLEVWRGRSIGGAAVIVFLLTTWEGVRYVLHR